ERISATSGARRGDRRLQWRRSLRRKEDLGFLIRSNYGCGDLGTALHSLRGSEKNIGGEVAGVADVYPVEGFRRCRLEEVLVTTAISENRRKI
ncbi:hypothetical protein U1Q18_000573, partial [Sarracenia purpurea var. burkii]